ncbi:MAG: energy-coupling factor transporter transmembrane protein EcfT [Clostridia bacterium]|nr:energy-coupling factor transporter transmembrane protein EcfT [Clostridia bacterium]
MLSDMTLGQYYPVKSTVHSLDPRMKIILLILAIVAVFTAGNSLAFLPVAAYIVLASRLSNVPFKMLLKGIRPLRFILIFTVVLNIFFLPGETVWLDLGFAKITKEAVITAIHYGIRLILLVMFSSLLTLTTAPVTLTDGLERLLSPLAKIRFPAHEMAMMMTIALRFIPTLLEEADKIMKAQSARGADFESGNLLARAKAMVPLLVPLFVSAFRRAGDLAMAMEARCYHGGKGRTRLHVLKMKKNDYIALLSMAVLLASVILISRFL